MIEKLIRFSVAMPEQLCNSFDELVQKRGNSQNRSEAIRDLVRIAIQEDQIQNPDCSVMGTLTIMYNHHANDLQEKLHDIQHDYCNNIISTLHVHVDAHTCLEVIILKGSSDKVQIISNKILGTKGVDLGKLVLTTIDQGEHIHSD